MTASEANAGSCPMCGAAVTPQCVAPKREAAAPSVQSPRLWHSLIWALGGTLAFCLLPIGILFYNYWPAPPAPVVRDNESEKSSPIIAEVKKKPLIEVKVEEKKQGDEKTEKTPDVKKERSKKEEKTVSDEKKKVDEKKKPQDKKEIAKKVEEIKPPPARDGFTNIPFVHDDAIKLDGDLDDWKGIEPTVLRAVERGRVTKEVVTRPREQKAYLAWNGRGLYIAVDIEDTSGALENTSKPAKGDWAFWDNDAVEVFIDTKNVRPLTRGAPHVLQYFALPFGTPGEPNIGGYESRITKVGSRFTTTVHAYNKTIIQRAAKKTFRGWAMEVFLPSSLLRQGIHLPGQIYGLEIQVDTGTNVYYYWANNDPFVHVSTKPNHWGQAHLAGSNGKVEILGEDMKPAQTFVPGKPITIRVSDADVNVFPDQKEKVKVDVISKASGRVTVELEETAVNSGVFMGTIATRLKLDRPAPNTLEVQADEVIEIEYLDLFTVTERNNQIVRATIAARKQ